jgi:outer membrane protein TolC
MTSIIGAALAISLVALSQDATEQPPLSLAEAVLTAEQADDASVQVWQARAQALEHRGESENALPDPMVRVGLANVPLSDFDLNREAMTQAQIGMRQMFPRGETRELNRLRRQAQATGAREGGELEQARIRVSVREAWLETYYWQQADALTRQSQMSIRQLGEIATASFATGRRNSHDVIRIELETSILDTRLIQIERQRELAQANLERFVASNVARRPLTPQLPILPATPPDLQSAQSRLVSHPMVRMLDAQVTARGREVDLALQQYRPGWAVEAGYGLRDSRSDAASVAVTVEVPLFSRRRQDEGVAAARQEEAADRLNRQATLLDLNRQLEREFSRYLRLSEERVLFEGDVLERARETARAVLIAYENEQADFAELVRAELALLDAELAFVRLNIDALQSQARILYLVGDVQ